MAYVDQYHRNRAMVMICSYMAQMGVNEQITWWDQCVQNVIQMEEVWDIGDSV